MAGDLAATQRFQFTVPKNQLYLFKDLILFLYRKEHTSKMLNKRKVGFNAGEVTQGNSQSTVGDRVSGTKLKN